MASAHRPLRVVYATFGSGSGDLMKAASLSTALSRTGVEHEFTAVSNCEFHYLFEELFEHLYVRSQPEMLFRADLETDLYSAIRMAAPDVLIISMIWLPLFPVLHELPGYKVFIARKSFDRWWRIESPSGKRLSFDPDQYDAIFNVEPNYDLPWAETTEPLVIRNPDELVPREEARAALGAEDGRRLCVVAQNGYAGELDSILAQRVADPGEYRIVPLQNTSEGKNIFPLAAYAKGIDFLVGGAGYNLFYEARYFDIPSHMIPFERNGDDQFWRVETNGDYSFSENGADQIARRIVDMVS